MKNNQKKSGRKWLWILLILIAILLMAATAVAATVAHYRKGFEQAFVYSDQYTADELKQKHKDLNYDVHDTLKEVLPEANMDILNERDRRKLSEGELNPEQTAEIFREARKRAGLPDREESSVETEYNVASPEPTPKTDEAATTAASPKPTPAGGKAPAASPKPTPADSKAPNAFVPLRPTPTSGKASSTLPKPTPASDKAPAAFIPLRPTPAASKTPVASAAPKPTPAGNKAPTASPKPTPANGKVPTVSASPKPASHRSIDVIIEDFYVLKSRYITSLDALIRQCKVEWRAKPKSEQTFSARLAMANKCVSLGNALEAECDAEMATLTAELRSALLASGQSTSIISQIQSVYDQEKQLKKAALIDRYYPS